MKKIKIAQIGTSKYSHGNNIFRSLKTQNDIFDLVGYALPEDVKEKYPEILGEFDGVREMTVEEILNDPEIEAVAVETEEIYLSKYAKMVADHGKHLHMEKPGGTSLEEFEAMIDSVRKSGKVFHTGYMYRYNPAVIKLLKDIENGDLGDIISVEAQMSIVHPNEQRQWLENFPGGMTFFLGCHLIDLIYRIQGEPEKVYPMNKCTGIDGVTSDDYGMVVFEYKNGISFAKTTDIERGGFQRRQLAVTGSKKSVVLQPLEDFITDTPGALLYTGVRETTGTSVADKGVVTRSDDFHRYDTMMAQFAKMVRGEIENPYTIDYEERLYKLVLKACGV